MKNKNKFLVILCLLSLAVGYTTAYFTHWMNLHNALSVGENTVGITEEFEPPKELRPGDNIYKKGIRIRNTGTTSSYVRVFMEFSDQEIKDQSKLSPDGKTYYSVEEYIENLPEGWKYVSKAEDAEFGGWYYYEMPVEPGSMTPYLLKNVNTHFDDMDQIRDYEIIVYAESVQTFDKEGGIFDSADQAWTEFMERR